MAHVAKYTRAEAGHLCKHHERAKDENGKYIRFGNQDIDFSRTEENYNLAPDRDGGSMEFIRRRCSEVKCLNRQDVNVMCSWIVTAPQSVAGNPEMEIPFFEKTYDFLKNRYGEENVVSAFVHMDEITPHMHFAFVPVVGDKKTQKLKVSAKERVNRADLQTFHTDLEKYLARYFGLEVGILNGATKDGSRSIEELKRKSAVDRLSEVELQTFKMKMEADRKAKKTARQIQQMTSDLQAAQKQLAVYKAAFDTFSEIDSMGRETTFGNRVTFTIQEATRLKDQAKAYWSTKSDAAKYKDDADRLRQRYSHLEQLDRETVPQLRQQLRELTEELKESNRKLDKVLAVVGSDSELAVAFNRQMDIANRQEADERRKRGITRNGYERQ